MPAALTNQTILDEINNRIRLSNETLDRAKLHPELLDALNKVESVGEEAVVKIQKQLEKTFQLWGDPIYAGKSAEAELEGAGFSWDYWGQFIPDPMGFGIVKLDPPPAEQEVTGLSQFKNGYMADAAVKGKTMGDTGGFDMYIVSQPFHSIVIEDQNPRYENDDEWEGFEYEDEVENLVYLQVALIVNEALQRAAKTEAFQAFKHTDRFYVTLNSHDDERFIVGQV